MEGVLMLHLTGNDREYAQHVTSWQLISDERPERRGYMLSFRLGMSGDSREEHMSPPNTGLVSEVKFLFGQLA